MYVDTFVLEASPPIRKITEKMIYFTDGNSATGYLSQKPIEDVLCYMGRTKREAFAVYVKKARFQIDLKQGNLDKLRDNLNANQLVAVKEGWK